MLTLLEKGNTCTPSVSSAWWNTGLFLGYFTSSHSFVTKKCQSDLVRLTVTLSAGKSEPVDEEYFSLSLLLQKTIK